MPKLTEQQLRDRAKMAAVELAPVNGVGEFLTHIEEEENVYTFLFAAKMKGYVGWTWSVSLFADDENTTVSEVNLMPGDESLVAPNWVPWAERLADYKALQAELEAAAAEESDSEESTEDESADEQSGDVAEVDQNLVDAVETEEVLATALSNESPNTEQDADDAGGRMPRFLRRRLGRLKYKK